MTVLLVNSNLIILADFGTYNMYSETWYRTEIRQYICRYATSLWEIRLFWTPVLKIENSN